MDLGHQGHGYRVALVGAARGDDRAHSRSPAPYAVDSRAPAIVTGTSRSYRGTLSLAADGTAVRLVDTVDVETYLLGLGEVRDSS